MTDMYMQYAVATESFLLKVLEKHKFFPQELTRPTVDNTRSVDNTRLIVEPLPIPQQKKRKIVLHRLTQEFERLGPILQDHLGDGWIVVDSTEKQISRSELVANLVVKFSSGPSFDDAQVESKVISLRSDSNAPVGLIVLRTGDNETKFKSELGETISTSYQTSVAGKPFVYKLIYFDNELTKGDYNPRTMKKITSILNGLDVEYKDERKAEQRVEQKPVLKDVNFQVCLGKEHRHKSVYVYGSWDSWNNKVLCHRSDEKFVVTLPLPPGTFQFKFIVGDYHCTSSLHPIVKSADGFDNNQITVQ